MAARTTLTLDSQQHNGEIQNGAKQTSKKRPWEMVLLVYGFPNSHAALYFEWAWQHPKEAKGLREELPRLKNIGNAYHLKAKINIMRLMLTLPPWNRFPLMVYWLTDSYHGYLADCEDMPEHMSSQIGKLEDLYLYKEGKNIENDELDEGDDQEEFDLVYDEVEECYSQISLRESFCHFCEILIEKEDEMKCISPNCDLVAHINCFALHFLSNDSDPGQLMPTQGTCPKCQVSMKWSSLVTATRKKRKKVTK